MIRIRNAAAARRQLEERLGAHDPDLTRTERATRKRIAAAAWRATLTALRHSRQGPAGTRKNLHPTPRPTSGDAPPMNQDLTLDVKRSDENTP